MDGEEKEARVSLDYLFFGSEPSLIVKDSKTKCVYAIAVDKKGPTAQHVVERVMHVIEGLGHRRIILRTDQENAIMDLSKELQELRRAYPYLPSQDASVFFFIEVCLRLGLLPRRASH